MSYPDLVSRWRETVSTAFPHLSRPQATVLALWSYGMVIAKSCGITLVCATLALQLGCSEASLVQRLREWSYGAKDKRGSNRQELEVSTCFARGLLPIVGTLIRGERLLLGRFVPEPWPCAPPALRKTNTKCKVPEPARKAVS